MRLQHRRCLFASCVLECLLMYFCSRGRSPAMRPPSCAALKHHRVLPICFFRCTNYLLGTGGENEERCQCNWLCNVASERQRVTLVFTRSFNTLKLILNKEGTARRCVHSRRRLVEKIHTSVQIADSGFFILGLI